MACLLKFLISIDSVNGQLAGSDTIVPGKAFTLFQSGIPSTGSLWDCHFVGHCSGSGLPSAKCGVPGPQLASRRYTVTQHSTVCCTVEIQVSLRWQQARACLHQKVTREDNQRVGQGNVWSPSPGKNDWILESHEKEDRARTYECKRALTRGHAILLHVYIGLTLTLGLSKRRTCWNCSDISSCSVSPMSLENWYKMFHHLGLETPPTLTWKSVRARSLDWLLFAF